MRNVFFLLLFFFSSCVAKKKCHEIVYFSDFSILVGSGYNKKRVSRLEHKTKIRLDGKSSVKIVLHECQGKADVWVFSKRKIVSKRSYLSSEQMSTDVLRIKEYDYVVGHYDPIKDGIWKYYDSDANVTKEEYWTNGFLDSVVKH